MSVLAASNTTAAAGPAASAPAGPKPPDPSIALILRVQVILLLLICIPVLYTLPRLVARFCNKSEWWAGLRTYSAPAPVRRRSNPSLNLNFFPGGGAPANARSDDSHAYLFQEKGYSPRTAITDAPGHFSAFSTSFPLVANILRFSVTPSKTVGELCIMLAYLGVLLYGVSWNNNPFAEPKRLGYVAASQLPILIGFAMKNNPVGWLVGVGYEKLNYLHRWAGRCIILIANVHMLGWIYAWTIAGTFIEKATETKILWGFCAVVAFDVMLLTSLRSMRVRHYEIFYMYHFTGVIVVLYASYFHAKPTHKYILAATGLYAADRVLRMLKTRVATASLCQLPGLGTTRLEVPSLNAGWRPGQHIFVRVVSGGMGVSGWTESHPFTIASVSQHPSEGLVLMIKNAGDWTRKLYELAAVNPKIAGYSEHGASERNVRVIIEGPYGGPGHTLVNSFDAAFLVAGGSGISYVLGMVDHITQHARSGASRVSTVQVTWTIQSPSALLPLLPRLSALVQDRAPGPAIFISVFYTRASAGAAKDVENMYLPPRLTLSTGRPRLADALDEALTHTASMQAGQTRRGIFAGVCGPAQLAADVRRVVGGVARRSAHVGGVELHEEAFGW